jgi:hypothetical protein
MKIYLIIGLIVSATLIAGAAVDTGQITVAVYNFTGEADAASYGEKVTALVTADLAMETNLTLVERAELKRALNEQAFGASGLVNAEAAAKIGQITGAKVLVTGQVVKTKGNHLVILANIIGTETGRLFATKVEGAGENLAEMTSDLSQKIMDTIIAQAANLIAPTEESREVKLDRIIKNIGGTNRPTVSLNITFLSEGGGRWRDNWAEYEFGAVLLKAGFTVLDDDSDRKADIEITGDASSSQGPERADIDTEYTAIEVKIVNHKTGAIIGFDRQEGSATAAGKAVAGRLSYVNTVDALAERILPLLAK